MNVYFVGHGESQGNCAGIHQDGTTQLSEYGLKQAETVARRFKRISVDVIFSSDFIRAAKTAEMISRIVQKKIVHLPILREMKRPTEIEGKHHKAPETMSIKKILEEHSEDPSWHFSDEENIYDFRKRALDFIDFLSKQQHKNIVVVSHGLFIRMIVAVMMIGSDAPIDEYHKIFRFLKHKNTGITLCRRDKDHWSLVTWNDHAHLG